LPPKPAVALQALQVAKPKNALKPLGRSLAETWSWDMPNGAGCQAVRASESSENIIPTSSTLDDVNIYI
jgi:hypothetical protein